MQFWLFKLANIPQLSASGGQVQNQLERTGQASKGLCGKKLKDEPVQ